MTAKFASKRNLPYPLLCYRCTLCTWLYLTTIDEVLAGHRMGGHCYDCTELTRTHPEESKP